MKNILEKARNNKYISSFYIVLSSPVDKDELLARERKAREISYIKSGSINIFSGNGRLVYR